MDLFRMNCLGSTKATIICMFHKNCERARITQGSPGQVLGEGGLAASDCAAAAPAAAVLLVLLVLLLMLLLVLLLVQLLVLLLLLLLPC